MIGIDGESYAPRDWRHAAYVVLIGVGYLLTLLMAWHAGTEHSAALALDSYAREDQYRKLLLPTVVAAERALVTVERHDSLQAAQLRAALPADVRTILNEVEP